MTGGLEVATRAVEGGYAALTQAGARALRPSAWPDRTPCRPRPGRRAALGQTDPAALEKGVDAFEPGPPVEVGAVVGVAVEGDELPARLVAQPQQKLVEDLAPRLGVKEGAVREDAFEVEEAGLGGRGQAEHRCAQRHRREPWHRPNPGASARGSTSIRAVCCRSRTSSLFRRRSSEGGSELPAARRARAAASSASCHCAESIQFEPGRRRTATGDVLGATVAPQWAPRSLRACGDARDDGWVAHCRPQDPAADLIRHPQFLADSSWSVYRMTSPRRPCTRATPAICAASATA